MAEQIEEQVEEIAEVTETTDQHGSAVPEGFAEQMEEALKTPDTEEEVSEEIADEVEEEVSEETDTDDVVDDDDVEEQETEEAEAEAVETSEEVKVEEQVAEQPVVEKPQEVEEIKFDLDPDLVDPSVKAAIDSMAEKLNTQQKSIDEQTQKLQAEREKIFENRIDSCFDRFSNDLPNIGNSSKLNKQNGSYRRELFEHAEVMVRRNGMSYEDAIKKTVTMFKNMDGEKKTEKRLITKLQSQKKTFTNPPTRKKSSPGKRKFKNETEMINHEMTKAYKEANIST